MKTTQLMKHNIARLLFRRPHGIILLLALFARLPTGGHAALDGLPVHERELRFASGLADAGFPGYAEIIIERLLDKHPELMPRAAPIRIQILTAQGRFEQAREIIDGMPEDATETLSMRLALGDAYYARNRIREAREIYDAFFARYPDGPPAALSVLYRESAYRYAQMMIHTGHKEEALEAFGYILLTNPEREITRRVQTEMAELAVILGERATDDGRDAYFEKAQQLCRDIQWGGQDLWFGKTVVILSHIEVIKGNTERARAIIREYMPMLRQIDQALRDEGAPLRFSPLAECRYQLGILHLRDAEAIDAGEEPDKAIEHYGAALRHLHNVFIQYPGSAWAMPAHDTVRRIVSALEAMGRSVEIPPFDMEPVLVAQLREARQLFDMRDFERAATAYRSIVNLFPESSRTVAALADLAQCYIELNRPLYARAITGYLAERYHRHSELKDEAGTALLRIAGAYENHGKTEPMRAVYDLFVRYYADHSRAPNVWMHLGEIALRDEDYARALERFQDVKQRFPDSRAALDAMSRIAYSHTARGNYGEAIPALRDYIEALSPGPRLLEARRRLADAYRSGNQFDEAAHAYRSITQIMEDDAGAARYALSPDDVPRNRQVFQHALFWLAYSLSRRQAMDGEAARVQDEAIEHYRRFIGNFPDSPLAPTALSMKGALYLLRDRSEDAARVYDRLARDYPESAQARDAVFAQGTSLIEMQQMERALRVFEQMFDNPDAFTPQQFLRVGNVMRDEQQHDTARRAFELAMATDHGPTWRHAAISQARILADKERDTEAAALMEELFERYPRSAQSIEAGFLLSRSYARMASRMDDQRQRADTFQQSIRTLRQVRRIAEKPVHRARADYELAAIQELMNARQDALASYLRLFLLGDADDPDTRPWVEKAYAQAVPLLIEAGQYEEILDTVRAYQEMFPAGTWIEETRRWRNLAIDRLTEAGIPIPETGHSIVR